MMVKLATATVVVAFLAWVGLSFAADEDNRLTLDEVEESGDRVLRGEELDLGRPWYYEQPGLAGIGVGVVVFLAGSVVVIAINSERRHP